MKILELNLLAYGLFTGVRLDFSGGQCGLHLVYGPNESGKSSALRALGDALYGIPGQTADNFVHSYKDLRLGATLIRDGKRLAFIRRKGNIRTLRREDDTMPLDDDALEAMLAGIDRATFQTMFGIGHEALVEGGKALASGEGEIGRMLFAAGAGIADLRTIQADLQKRATDLFKSGGSVPVINRRLAEIKALRSGLREHLLSMPRYQQHVKELERVNEQMEANERDLESIRCGMEWTKRMRDALPVVAQRKERLRKLDEVRETILLREDFREQLTRVQEALKAAREAEANALEKLAAIADEMKRIRIPEPVLAAGDRISKLYQTKSSIEKAAADRIRLQAGLKEHEANALELIRKLPHQVPLDEARELELGVTEPARIHALSAQYAEVQSELRTASEKKTDLDDQLQQLQQKLAGLAVPPDASELERALSRITKAGISEENSERLRTDLERVQSQIGRDVGTLPLWSGEPEQLEQLPVPSTETLQWFEQKFGEWEQSLRDLHSRLDEREREIREVDSQLGALEREEPILTLDDLTRARELRDLGWTAVRRAWEEGALSSPEQDRFLAAMSPVDELAEAFEESVRRTDETSDRLRRDADRVQEKAGLNTRRRECEEQVQGLRSKIAEAERERSALQVDWLEQWKPTRISPRSPKEMLAWLHRREALIMRIQQWREQSAEVGNAERAIQDARAELERLLTGLGQIAEPGRLAALIDRSQAWLKRDQTLRQERKQTETDLLSIGKQLASAKKRCELAERAMIVWREQWAEAMRPIHLGARASTSEAQAVLDALTNLSNKLGEINGLRTRIDKIDRDAERFTNEVLALVAEVEPELASMPPVQAVAQLHETLLKGRTARDVLAAHRKTKATEEKSLVRAQKTVQECTEELSGLCCEAQCEEPRDLPSRVDRSSLRRKIEQEIADFGERLLLISSGRTVEELVAEAEGLDGDTLTARLDTSAQRVQELNESRKTLQDELIELKRQETGMAGGDQAARLMEDLQGVQASLAVNVTECVRFRAASFVLQRAIERYREKNQGPVLERASRIFAALTDEGFRSLRIDLDEAGRSVLKGMRAADGKSVGMEGLSDGTRDQLYLALRIASLEDYCEEHDPIPLIVDDVLVNFDDARALAALRILADLSRRTQVIFFTHHQHIANMAEKHLGGEVLHRQDLTADALRSSATA